MQALYKKCLVLLKTPLFYFCSLFAVFNIYFSKHSLLGQGKESFILVLIAELIIEILLITLILRMNKKNIRIEKQFLIIAVILGMFFIIFMPPGEAPDDVTHFTRAYSISSGAIIPEVTNDKVSYEMPIEVKCFPVLPSDSTYNRVLSCIKENTEDGTKDQPYTAAALYNFVCYIPQTLAIIIGKIFNMSIVGMGYLVEIFNFVTWLSLVYFAIKIIPKFKTLLVFISLLPITLQEATSMSPDALTIGLCALMVSFVLYLTYGKKEAIEKRDLILLYIMAILVGFCKIVYLPLVLLFLVIPSKKFGEKKKKVTHLILIFTITAIVNISWLIISSRYLVSYNDGVNSGEQLKGIIGNPIGYLGVIIETINNHIGFWLSGMLGSSLGAFVFDLPMTVTVVSFSICLLLFSQREGNIAIKTFDKVVFSFAFIAIFVLILTSLYMQWTPVGNGTVEGVQGRYFLPILLLIPAITYRNDTSKKRTKYILVSERFAMIYVVFLNVIALITVLSQNI